MTDRDKIFLCIGETRLNRFLIDLGVELERSDVPLSDAWNILTEIIPPLLQIGSNHVKAEKLRDDHVSINNLRID